uniref:Uncharacterized protein n=1 Tax=Castor canadensis TaxID=51338 RepID=A0A8C0WAM9_CASCN
MHAQGPPTWYDHTCWHHWGRVVGLMLSYGLEIFIFAYVIHTVQVANFVNSVYSLCPHVS